MLSVVIPAYNVEDTFERCIKSVLGQGVDDMEVIIVNDGSTDNTPRLCEKYASTAGITTIHQQNAGLSEARNTGIRIARGELITFVDTDDYLAPGTYLPLVNMMKEHPECDILEYSVVKEDGEHVLRDLRLPDHEYTDMAEYWIEGQAYSHCYAWNKIYRRRLFDNVRFPRGKKFEDVYTLSELLKEATNVRTTSLGLYHYTLNPKGITVQADGQAWRDLLQAHIDIVTNPQLRKYKGFADYYSHVLNIQISTYENTGDSHDIMLPTLPYYGSLKLKLLHLIGMKGLCRVFRKLFCSSPSLPKGEDV